jgi:hypothetical protein
LKKLYRRLLVCAVAAAPMATPAAAQTLSGSMTHTISTPLTRTTDVRVVTDFVYDSDVLRGRRLLANQRGLVPHDEIIKPALAIDIVRMFGRNSVFVNGAAGYDFYNHDTLLNRERIDAQGGFSSLIHGCKAMVSGGYARHQSNLEDLQLIVTKNTETNELIKFDGDCAKQVGIAPQVSVSEEWMSNSAITRRTVDHNSLVATGALAYSQPALGQMSLFGQFEQTQFPNRIIPIGNTILEDQYKLYAGGLRFTHNIGSRIEGEVSVSYTSLQPNLPGVPGFNGLTYAIDVSYKPTTRIQTHAAFSRQTEPSNRAGSSYSIGNLYSGDLTYQFGTRIALNAGASYAIRDFVGSQLVGPVFITHEQIKRVFGSLRYDVTRRISCTLHAEQRARNANVAQFSYSATIVGLELAVKL